MVDSIKEKRIQQIKGELFSQIKKDIESCITDRVNGRFEKISEEDKRELIEEMTSHYLDKIDEDSILAALVFQLEAKIDKGKEKLFNTISEIQKEVSMLQELYKLVNPTIQNHISSFREATDAYKQISQDLRANVTTLATRDSVSSAVTQVKNELLQHLSSKRELENLQTAIEGVDKQGGLKKELKEQIATIQDSLKKTEGELNKFPAKGEFRGWLISCTGIVLSVAFFGYSSLDNKYSDFKQSTNSEIQEIKNSQQEILQKLEELSKQENPSNVGKTKEATISAK